MKNESESEQLQSDPASGLRSSSPTFSLDMEFRRSRAVGTPLSRVEAWRQQVAWTALEAVIEQRAGGRVSLDGSLGSLGAIPQLPTERQWRRGVSGWLSRWLRPQYPDDRSKQVGRELQAYEQCMLKHELSAAAYIGYLKQEKQYKDKIGEVESQEGNFEIKEKLQGVATRLTDAKNEWRESYLEVRDQLRKVNLAVAGLPSDSDRRRGIVATLRAALAESAESRISRVPGLAVSSPQRQPPHALDEALSREPSLVSSSRWPESESLRMSPIEQSLPSRAPTVSTRPASPVVVPRMPQRPGGASGYESAASYTSSARSSRSATPDSSRESSATDDRSWIYTSDENQRAPQPGASTPLATLSATQTPDRPGMTPDGSALPPRSVSPAGTFGPIRSQSSVPDETPTLQHFGYSETFLPQKRPRQPGENPPTPLTQNQDVALQLARSASLDSGNSRARSRRRF
jgi:hypothetical protein